MPLLKRISQMRRSPSCVSSVISVLRICLSEENTFRLSSPSYLTDVCPRLLEHLMDSPHAHQLADYGLIDLAQGYRE